MSQSNFELSASFVESFESGVVNLALQSIDALGQADALVVDSATNLARLFGTEPSVETWEGAQDLFIDSLMGARKITEKTAKNIWYQITKVMEVNFELVKPKATSKDAKRMTEKRQAIEAMTDAELEKAGMLVELAKRKEKALKETNKAHIASLKEQVKANKEWLAENVAHNHALMAYLKNNLDKVIALAKKSS
jgi:hypothetical protein